MGCVYGCLFMSSRALDQDLSKSLARASRGSPTTEVD